MDDSKRTKIQYASKYARTSNYWKYYIGQSKGLKSMKVSDKKIALEEKFRSWVDSDQTRSEKYGEALNLIERAYQSNKNIELNRTYLNEAIFMGAEIMYWSFKMHAAITKLPKEGRERDLSLRELKKEAREFYKNYNTSVDQELFG